jgi:GWxTD domain-containing protein
MQSHYFIRRFFRGFLSFALLFFITAVAQKAYALQAVVTRNIFYAPVEKDILKPYLEVYWQVDPRTVAFKQTDGKWQAALRTDIVLRTDTGIVHEDHYILTNNEAESAEATRSETIIDLRRYMVGEGKFWVSITLTDEARKSNQYVYKDSFAVKADDQQPMISDIQLVDTAIVSSGQSVFQRNGKTQIPLCTNFFDEGRKILHYYAETYHTNRIDTIQAPLVERVFISRKQFEEPVNDLLTMDTVSVALLQIAEGDISLATLPSGNYYLNIVLEHEHKPIASKALFFQLLNKNPQAVAKKEQKSDSAAESALPTFLNLNKTFVARYTPAQIRAILKMLIPIATPNEKVSINGFIKRPDDTYARYFVYNFWVARNKLKPEEAWKDYAEKVKKVNKLFGSTMLNGYENDRGMIYLKYGEPTERIQVENESGALPYEVWQYNTLDNATNAVFLFYRAGFVANDYRLLHSTVNGEMKNRRWRETLYPNGASQDASNSRAEQYLGNR